MDPINFANSHTLSLMQDALTISPDGRGTPDGCDTPDGRGTPDDRSH